MAARSADRLTGMRAHLRPPSLLALSAIASLGACAHARWVPVECSPGVLPRPALVRDSAGVRVGELAGTVTLGDPHGRPLEQSWVSIVGPRTDSVTADSAGRFRFSGLPEGRYVLRARHLGVALRTDTLDVGSAAGTSLIVPLAVPYFGECSNLMVRRR